MKLLSYIYSYVKKKFKLLEFLYILLSNYSV